MESTRYSTQRPIITVAQQVQANIRELIFHEKLHPGERIDQNNLAEDLGVSLVPVREALKGLEAEGFVKIIPRRGAFVTEVSIDHLNDLYRARQLIEGEAAFHAMSRISDQDIDTLKHLHDEMKAATSIGDVAEFMRLNRLFHMTIYDAVDSEIYLETVSGLWDRSELYRYRYMYVIHHANNAHHDHEAIIHACESRDAATVKQLIVAHIQHTLDGLHREFEDA